MWSFCLCKLTLQLPCQFISFFSNLLAVQPIPLSEFWNCQILFWNKRRKLVIYLILKQLIINVWIFLSRHIKIQDKCQRSRGSSSEKKLLKRMVSSMEWPWSQMRTSCWNETQNLHPDVTLVLTTTPASYVIDFNKYSTIRIFVSSLISPNAKNTEVNRATCERPDWVVSPVMFYLRKSSSCLQSVKSKTRRGWFPTDSSRSSAPDNGSDWTPIISL